MEWRGGNGHRNGMEIKLPFLTGMEWEQNGLVALVTVLAFSPPGTVAELMERNQCQI